MFSRMGAQRVAVTSDGALPLDVMIKNGVRDKPDVAALASRDDRRLTIMAWHYHDDDVAGPAAEIALTVEGLPMKQGMVKVQQFRIDADHSNAYTAWQRMGSPQQPTPEQYAQLEKAGQLTAVTGTPATVEIKQSRGDIKLTLPRQAVTLLVLEW
jgi:xylan 1,4-beta-xylosidase